MTSGKISRDALINRIKTNQAMFDEHSESIRHQGIAYINPNSSSQWRSEPADGIQMRSSIALNKSKDQFNEDSNMASLNLRQIGINEMHSKNLAKELIFSGRDYSRRNEKVNNSCIIVSKSHANLDARSFDHQTSKEFSNVQSAFDLLIETLSALEADIARNFKVISTKFSSFNQDMNKMKFDLETCNDNMNSYEK